MMKYSIERYEKGYIESLEISGITKTKKWEFNYENGNCINKSGSFSDQFKADDNFSADEEVLEIIHDEFDLTNWALDSVIKLSYVLE